MKRSGIAVVVIIAAVQAAATARVMHATSTRGRAPAMRSVWDSVYTGEQATRGQVSYNQTCARCHLTSLAGADESPALVGGTFLGNWNGQNLGVLYERIRTSMPHDDPGTYGRQLVADVVAYMLKMNGFPAGAVELPQEPDVLKGIKLDATKP